MRRKNDEVIVHFGKVKITHPDQYNWVVSEGEEHCGYFPDLPSAVKKAMKHVANKQRASLELWMTEYVRLTRLVTEKLDQVLDSAALTRNIQKSSQGQDNKGVKNKS